MHVVVTGAAGHLGQVLLPALLADRRVTRVTAIDRAPLALDHPRLAVRRGDAAELAAGTLRGADALVHLAFVLLRGWRSRRAMARANVDMSRRVFSAAADAGVARLLFLSSAAVYGGGEQLTEAAPLDPLPGFAYAADKMACERWLMAELPRAVRLRPHIVLGPRALPLLKRLVHLRVGLRQAPPLPRLQLVHEQDVVAAIGLALARDVSGPFNLATDDAFTLNELVAYAGGARLRLSPAAARALLRGLWLLAGAGGEPGWGGGLTRSLTLDTERARLLLGWRPAYAGWRQVLLSMAEGMDEAKR